MSTSQHRGRLTLFGLASLFFLPVLAAFYLYYNGGWRPAGSTTHGKLIIPARPLPSAEFLLANGTPAARHLFKGKWTLAYRGNGQCDDACIRGLWVMRQTRLLLTQDMERVQRVFIAEEDCCNTKFFSREHPGLAVVTAQSIDALAVLTLFPSTNSAHSVYIIDPLGNLMMRFDTRENPKGLLTDLKKLLKLSHIG